VTQRIAQVACALAVAAVSSATAAQVMLLPTPPPTVVADDADWYRLGEPIPFADTLYYPAGAIVHFDGNRLVRSGSYRGVPFYTDKFLDQYGKIFVPLSGGLMRPYERRRDGDLAGTTGSQAPSFPVSSTAEAARGGLIGTGPVAWAPALRADETVQSDRAIWSLGDLAARTGRAAVGTSGTADVIAASTGAVVSLQRPIGLNAVFITYKGGRWRPAGPAVEFQEARFRPAEEYRGFQVFVERDGGASRIYLPSRDGMVVPYEPMATTATPTSPDRPQPRRK
jgi:hypothetical protein